MNEIEKAQITIDNFPKWKQDLHRIIFGYQTFGGRLFDIILLVAIGLSVITVTLESVSSIKESYGNLLIAIEWIFTILFTAEYIARILCHPKPIKYILSPMGLIDLLSIIPTYLSLFTTASSKSLSVIRAIRLIRIFRILKLTHFIGGAQVLSNALWHSRHKITVFLGTVVCIVVIVGTLLYVVEGSENGFTSIPKSIYWAIVTLTTVGYGDIAPQTVLGQFLASIVMIMGYAILAVPTGIVTGEIIAAKELYNVNKCKRCKTLLAGKKANYCHICGESST